MEKINLPEYLQRAAKIRINEELYNKCALRGWSLTELLEEMNPSETGDVLDAFERQLKLRNIKIAGEGADVIERFFASNDNKVLFPEFISRQIRFGIDQYNKLGHVIATRTKINDDTYKTLYLSNAEAEKQLAKSAEGAELPAVEMKTSEHTLKVYKYGRYLETTYEAIRRKKANVVVVFLRAIGIQIAQDKFADAVDVAINGDGNNNAAAVINTASSGTLTYADLVNFWLCTDPYTMNVMVVNKETAQTLLTLAEFKDPEVGQSFLTKGELITPLGCKLLVDESVPADKVLGLDNRYAIEEVFETNLITEAEKLIRKQIEGTAVSEVAGFGKLFNDATKVLDVTWS